jgi:putative flippase GtrA
LSEGPNDPREPRRVTGLRLVLSSERARFLIVGAINTGVGYGFFVLIQFLVGRYTSYFVSLYGSYLLATVVAFTLHRRFTFRVSGSGNLFVDFFRFQAISLIALLVNSLILPILVTLLGWEPILAQAVIVIVTTLISYFGHKFISFRRPKPSVQPPIANSGDTHP